ncbi:hypothetical protein AB0K51_20060 [Kitasatospora sp. NPDC049285]|uniref:hypothetical protein n=1 Tax=Kitasatospora sp. NPDC049285 TaxID=3157096 RepID=UPI00341AC4CB
MGTPTGLVRALAALALTLPALAAAVLAAPTPAAALDNGLALTPPMGWNSWNTFGPNITLQQVVRTIDHKAANGLVAAGYDTVTVDDGWSLWHRDGQSSDIVRTPEGAMQLYDDHGNPVSGTDGTGNDPTSGHLLPRPPSSTASSPPAPTPATPPTCSTSPPATPGRNGGSPRTRPPALSPSATPPPDCCSPPPTRPVRPYRPIPRTSPRSSRGTWADGPSARPAAVGRLFG